MNDARRSPKSKVESPKSRVSNPRFVVCVICGCLLLPGCLRLDSFLFEPTTVAEYLQMSSADSAAWHVRGIIPDSLVEPVTLTGLSGNKVYGFFVRQPSAGDCPQGPIQSMGTVPGKPQSAESADVLRDPSTPLRSAQGDSASSAKSADVLRDPSTPLRSAQGDSASSAKSADVTSADQFTVLYNHGNGKNINRYWGRVELLWEAGCNVFIYDYEGFGKSEGSPSGAACHADAEAALAYVIARPDVVDSNVVYYAWSLGSFMACHLAADLRTPRCLILENPMASMSAVAKEGAVLGIPGSFLVDADFDNETRIPLVGCRTLIIYGKQDDTAVPERNALVLLDKANPSTTTSYPVDGAGHSDLPEVMGYGEYERVVSAFIAGDSSGHR